MTTKNDYKSEAGHWYDHDGNPMYTIIGANGKERNTTLRDAKKEGFVPSVTTIIGIAAKPSLENWSFFAPSFWCGRCSKFLIFLHFIPTILRLWVAILLPPSNLIEVSH